MTCKDVLNSISNLKMMLEIRHDDRTYFDYQMLESLRACSDDKMEDYATIRETMKNAKKRTTTADVSTFGNLFHEPDYHFYKGVMYFYEGKFAEAGKNFKRALDLSVKEVEGKEYEDSNLIEFYRLSFSNRCFNYF